jgi:1,4-alpha-glucan branching enzyme
MRTGVYPVTFRYIGSDARSVSVVGSFNHWDPAAHCLTLRNCEWRTTVFLPAGAYPYAFVVDDRLVPDPDPARALRGPMDTTYSVVVIPAEPTFARTA